jgi:hypothetical protein
MVVRCFLGLLLLSCVVWGACAKTLPPVLKLNGSAYVVRQNMQLLEPTKMRVYTPTHTLHSL